ncbi:MAG: sugar phosphate isomerase/epimerase [Bacilli bacterium]|nr:sugar phosphate isomerase/epimerase [Bacilli bacterium]
MRFNIGIRGHDLPNAPFLNVDDFINTFKQYDLDYLQLVISKAFKDFEFNKDNLTSLANKLKANDIKVAMIGAYFNMIHPDKVRQSKGINYFKDCMKYAYLFDTKYVGSETGSLNGDKWIYVDGNHTLESFNTVKEVIKDLKNSERNASPLIEGAWNHVVYKPTLLYELLNDLNLDACTVDLYNYLNIDNYKDHLDIFKECINLFGEKIKVIHIKDFIVEDNKLVQVGIGKGLMNYKEIMPLIKKHLPNVILVLEGVKEADIVSSIKYLRSYEDE